MDPYSSDRTTPEKNSPTEGEVGTHRQSVFTDSPIDIAETEGDYFSKDEEDAEMTSKKAKTDENKGNDDDTEEKSTQMKRSSSVLRFDRWNVGTRYQLTRILGQGSYGEVAEAWDTMYVLIIFLISLFLLYS